ncbi:GNAT family N-acetyltransferase [Cellulomonas oligotrophica]|uniref:Phosphinothricin acetyltransferase n=1 Tax=Cellulomonas oligotrophica TaxID=931536 RepID=A0A7Y9JZF0_9CELL|nr:GNAT family N-acetyltransferase [Cellulomonas oligotrophica]NYD86719.1 phosphinothricin acetyltransferase [Cellulomonas oligotrophica]GIG34566.1 hypothetical protein Col01nite_37250 [Cellulomonas oligotrophica]
MTLFAEHRPDLRGVPDPALVVRVAAPDDVDAVVSVAATRGERAPGFRDQVAAWAQDPARHVLVADRRGEVVGWAMLARWVDPTDVPDGWYVSALTVHPAWRRRHAGDRLLRALLTCDLAADGPVRSVVNAGNGPSLALHRRHGFVEVRRAATLAGITFVGGTGVLLAADRGERGRA